MKSTLVEISVIIPFHGEKNDLLRCIKALSNQSINLNSQIIVVESGYQPEVKELINKDHNINLISSHSLLFAGKARNLGVANSTAKLLAFIDADCVPSLTWLSEVYSSLINGNEIVVGPVINLYPLHPVASVDNLIQFLDFQKHRSPKGIDHFPGCNFGITKELFTKSGGFPEETDIGEDTKFSEIVLKGLKAKISFNKKMTVQHSGRKELTSFLKHHVNFGYYRGYTKHGISSVYSKFNSSFVYSIIFGIKRLIIICIRTLQWNPAGLLRIIFYFPCLILGLSAWVIGFIKGNQKAMEEKR